MGVPKQTMHISNSFGSSSSNNSEDKADDSILSNLVFDFDIDELIHSTASDPSDCTAKDEYIKHAMDALKDLLYSGKFDHPISDRLNSDIIWAAKSLAGLRSDGSAFRQALVARLQEMGYDAGICKANWERSGDLQAGNYEYLDVFLSTDDYSRNERYIVDLDFSVQFEVARATEKYQKLVAMLPAVMVGRAEEVKQVVRVMTEAANKCLKSKGLSMPPWRKRRYMNVKWFGDYRRMINPLSSSVSVRVGDQVQCRAVGFDCAIWRKM